MILPNKSGSLIFLGTISQVFNRRYNRIATVDRENRNLLMDQMTGSPERRFCIKPVKVTMSPSNNPVGTRSTKGMVY